MADGLDMQTRRFVVCGNPLSLAIERGDQWGASTGVARGAGVTRVVLPGKTQRPVVENAFSPSPRAGGGARAR